MFGFLSIPLRCNCRRTPFSKLDNANARCPQRPKWRAFRTAGPALDPPSEAPWKSRLACMERQTRKILRDIYDGILCSMRVRIWSIASAPPWARVCTGLRLSSSARGVANQWEAFCSSPKTATACATPTYHAPSARLLRHRRVSERPNGNEYGLCKSGAEYSQANPSAIPSV